MIIGAREVAFRAFDGTRGRPRRSVLWVVRSGRGIVIWDLLPPGRQPEEGRAAWTCCGDLAGVPDVVTIVRRLEDLVDWSRASGGLVSRPWPAAWAARWMS